MQRARLMDAPEDYRRLGVDPGRIQPWEDGHRNTGEPGHWEWWYFDCILDDGSTAVVQFFGKGFPNLFGDGLAPFGLVRVTRPDGTAEARQLMVPLDQCSFGTDECAVQIGPHSFTGDLRDYDIHVEPVDGLGVNLHLHSTAKPFRPGTAYFGFGDNDEEFFTWLCAVPKGEVSGSITIDGRTVEVRGAGYHDHQWGSNVYLRLFNHWTWARQRYDDYTVVLFDMIASDPYGNQRFPLFFVQDADGNLLFTNTTDVDYELLENSHDEATGKDYPKKGHYHFHDEATGRDFDYMLTWNSLIEENVIEKLFPADVRDQLAEVHPQRKGSYNRYLATGDLVIRDGDETINRSDDLIYEFMYPGTDYKQHI